jgi:hypothetical protein
VLLVSHRSQRVTILTREARAGEQVLLQDPRLSLSGDALSAGIVLDPA